MQKATSMKAIQLASWTQGRSQSTIQRLLAIATQPDILSLALGLPATELFPASSYAQATSQVLGTNPSALQYGPPCKLLKRHIVEIMGLRGVSCTEEQVFLTNGAQQAMSLLARLFLNPGGAVLLEETIYSGILQAIEPLQPTLLLVPTHPNLGIDLDAVEVCLCSKPKPAFLYTISDGHNPLGLSLPAEKRHRLVELACTYGVPIIEDDAYGLLHYEKDMIPPMRALDEQWVFYIGSFSKILAPALRTGWMIVPEAFIPLLSMLKEGSDINTATLAQRTIAAFLDNGHLTDHLKYLRQVYRVRRDTMSQTLRKYFPPTTHWHMPASGMFIWVEMPAEMDTSEVLERALQQQRVAFVPGAAFSADGSLRAHNFMRLNFSRLDVDDIKQAIFLLSQVIS